MFYSYYLKLLITTKYGLLHGIIIYRILLIVNSMSRCEYCDRRVIHDDSLYYCEETGEYITNEIINSSDICEGYIEL